MIRPSMLQLAESCGLAARLAEQYPETSVAAERGTALHVEIQAWLQNGLPPTSPEVKALAASWRPSATSRCEMPVRFEDPETGELITEGTTDYVDLSNPGALDVVDWKSGLEDYVPVPDENLQLLAYGLGAALALDYPAFRVALCFLREAGPEWRWSRLYAAADWWPLLERVKRAASRGPEAVKGPHCDGCWQRRHCTAWLLPAYEGSTALEPFTRPGGLTRENAPLAIATVKALKDVVELAEAHLKDMAREAPIRMNGKEWGPTQVSGRKTADVRALEAAGLTKFVKVGEPYERFGWRKATG